MEQVGVPKEFTLLALKSYKSPEQLHSQSASRIFVLMEDVLYGQSGYRFVA
jgi:hypothetical protein